MKLIYFFLLTLSAAIADESFNPFNEPFSNKSAEKTTLSIVSENLTVKPDSEFSVAITISHQKGWHAYYKNPGGPGLPLTFDWKLPEGFTLTKLHWPTPHIYTSNKTQFYVYENEYTFIADIHAPKNAPINETKAISVTPSWQICNDRGCDPPQSKEISTIIKIAKESKQDTNHQALFKEARELIPLDAIPWDVTISDKGKNYTIELKSQDSSSKLKDIYFMSSDNQTNGAAPQKLTNEGDIYTLTIPKAHETGNEEKVKRLPHLSGILYSETGWSDDNHGYLLEKVSISKPSLKSAKIGKFITILGGMLLGGLILNLMPCVFPVIGLKIMGFAQQAGEEKSKIVLHGITFASGIITSFWVIAGILLYLRNKALTGAGEDVGWGYQLQNPYVVLTILLLMFILALNMFGVFEIGTSATSVGGNLQNKQGLQGSFFSGVLATIVATPCSAPFLGAAIGAAFALPNIQFMLAFTSMAIGLALPYLILSIFPNLIKMLPRPGAWMESFKQGMSFLLFATAGYMLWIYITQIGLDSMLSIILGLSAISMALWVYGRWNLPHRTTKVRTIAKVLTVLGLVIGIMACWPPEKKLHWEKWSESRVEELLEQETPVYVDFTATWCATCQVNKRTAYTDDVVKLFKEYNVVTLKGDKTSPDPAIEKKLQELGRTAIPVNVLYVPGRDEPIITPEILTEKYLKKLIKENLKKKKD